MAHWAPACHHALLLSQPWASHPRGEWWRGGKDRAMVGHCKKDRRGRRREGGEGRGGVQEERRERKDVA